MKNNLGIASGVFILLVLMISCAESNQKTEIDKIRQKHQTFLDNSPYKESQHLSRKDRKAMALPPNAYYEQLWDLTMDPNTGRPMPERLYALQADLIAQRNFSRGVGGDISNPWVSRGPNNQGGRTRGIMFDPNDIGNVNPADDYTRVFAGSVSGGLWVNEDITNSNSSWTLVTGMQANISVTTIISDPNNSNTFYIGSGESFTFGDAVGRGVWKSVDGGVTWQNIFGGFTGFDPSTGYVHGIFYINDIVARNVAGITQLYIGVANAYYGSASAPRNFNGLNDTGVYKSLDGGVNWTRFPITHGNGVYKNPCDLEIDINNNIWFTTTRNDLTGNAGGDIYRSTDGLSFTLIHTIPNARRTELEISSTDANRFWLAVNVGGAASLFTTDDAFSSITAMDEPNDADDDISETDYTRGQAFYDLPIEADQNSKLYVGGIDWHVSANNGADWTQVSKWSNNSGLNTLNVPLIHADQHTIVFRPGSNGSQAVLGNDGGVYFASDLTVTTGGGGIPSRNKDYNTTQFYYGAIDGLGGSNGDDLAGGTQDNGTQTLVNGDDGPNPFNDFLGGDGGFTEIDDIDAPYMITTYPYNNHVFLDYPAFTLSYIISTAGDSEESNGSFINEAALDKNLNILYSNISSGGTRGIERTSDFMNGQSNVVNTTLTNDLLNSSPSAFKVSQFNTVSSTLFVGLRNGRLLKANSADSSPIWSNIAGSEFVGSISDIEFGQSEEELFVTMHNYGVQSIWYTNNSGTSWRSLEGNLPDIPVKCILQNPLIPNELIIGTDLGVWATADFTVSNPVWIPTFNGMSDAKVLDLDLRASDNTILASTYGRGLFTSTFTSTTLSALENEVATNQISVYPTVSNGQINIVSKSNLGTTRLEIYNVSGQKVFNKSVNLSGDKMNLGLTLSSGMYFLKFKRENFVETKRIVIK